MKWPGAPTGPIDFTHLHRHLARELRRLREHHAHLTIDQAAQQVKWDRAVVWHIECGDVFPRREDVAVLCHLYQADSHTAGCLLAIATHAQPAAPQRQTHAHPDDLFTP